VKNLRVQRFLRLAANRIMMRRNSRAVKTESGTACNACTNRSKRLREGVGVGTSSGGGVEGGVGGGVGPSNAC